MERNLCCGLFADSLMEGIIIKSTGHDETAWHFKDWLHIYYCPFCGKSVKGKGFGTYDVEVNKISNKRLRSKFK